jgi:hypothetical protein
LKSFGAGVIATDKTPVRPGSGFLSMVSPGLTAGCTMAFQPSMLMHLLSNPRGGYSPKRLAAYMSASWVERPRDIQWDIAPGVKYRLRGAGLIQ